MNPVLDWSIAQRTKPGEKESGDRYLVRTESQTTMVAVIDGVGHGSAAAAAARVALSTVAANIGGPLVDVMHECHAALQQTRGAVISLATFSAREDRMAWLSVGNVESVLIRLSDHGLVHQEMLPLYRGVVGNRIPNLAVSVLPIRRGDILILATDGIRTGFADDSLRVLPSTQEVAARIAADYWRGDDDALVLVARYDQDGHKSAK
jgi:negative regulator of sigma-B (phosphoserine phosphatase)